MKTTFSRQLLLAAIVSLSPCTATLAQVASADATKASMERAGNKEGQWYFSWGYSRQQYAPSDIHVSQPELGNDFTVHKAAASDYPSSVSDTLGSLVNLDFTNPQENVRVGRFMNPEKTFAIEFSLDHSKYNVDLGQTVAVSGTINNQPAGTSMVVTPQNFYYALHNGLNHIMVNGVLAAPPVRTRAADRPPATDQPRRRRHPAAACREHHPG